MSPIHVALFASALGALAVAPFQCPSKPDPTHVREDTPGEALYDLAQRFGNGGDRDGKIKTLQYLAERYPRSRFAVRAREDLKELGVPMPEPTIGTDLEREGVPFGRLPSDPPSASASAAPGPAASGAPKSSSSP